ncbi:hypothetical protein JZU61_07960 [bacterium]|nr:hypothetical protein [bacterium]
METQTTAQTVIPTIPLSACKIVGLNTEANEKEGIHYSDVCVGNITNKPHYAQVTVRNGGGSLSVKLKEYDIAMIDTSISKVNCCGCIWLFEHEGRLLIRELQVKFTKEIQYRAVMDGEIFKADQMQVIGRVVGIYTPFRIEHF